ncbi:MAG TPA: endonuclease/exonuclease/phosphatase family protein [Blastococcus sp.]|nr:endonuclease/exonuclease/phosphatase family protein [Blastococcus sp.]
MTGAHGVRPAPGPEQPPIPVRLVTFNTHHGVGEDSKHDLARLAKVLAAVEADVICLQELDRHFGDRSEGVDQALLLSRALDMQLAWGPAIDEPQAGGRPDREYGNALLSRLPILVSDVHRLPGGGEPRSALRTMLELDGGTLWVTATHLSTGNPERRAAQVSALAGLHTDGMAAGVLVGDFNTGPEAPELAALRARFADAWELAADRDDRSGWRFWQHDEGLTHPAHFPHRRIDQVWVTPSIGVPAARVLDAQGASDHLPVLVDLRVPSGV